MDSDRVERGLVSWRGGECARFVVNLDLPQYAESFAFNLRGTTLPRININQLVHLGVRNFAHQKAIMEGVRQLLEAFSRRERTQKANESWQFILDKASRKKDDDEDTESDLSEPLPPLLYATPGNAPRRRGQGSGRVVVQGSGGGGGGRYQQQELLPINLHLPKIAAMHQQDAARATQPKARGLYAAKPSVVPPASPMANAAGAGGAGGEQQTEWKELARSYGLHLLPENGPLLQDNLTAALGAPQPPDLRFPHPPSLEAALPMGAGASAYYGKPVPDLSASPSLPMLSPGRVGVRNWVTFLHG
jgi:hypothetical protein